MKTDVLFELDGKPVRRGDRLHVAPGYYYQAGAEVEADYEASGGSAVFRAVPSGAVPTLPVSAVSWSAHPDTLDLEAMSRQGIGRPSVRDLSVWRLGRAAALQSDQRA